MPFTASEEPQWVGRAGELGATRAQIGEAPGVTRQSAWERFAPDD